MGASEQPISVSHNEQADEVQQLVRRSRRFLPSHVAMETVRACNAKCFMPLAEPEEV